jgi:hypothetical protein
MSYTDGIFPKDFQFALNPTGLVAEFTCPRCGLHQHYLVDPQQLYSEVEFICSDPRCVADGERPGYILVFRGVLDGSMLSLTSRPLHPET